MDGVKASLPTSRVATRAKKVLHANKYWVGLALPSGWGVTWPRGAWLQVGRPGPHRASAGALGGLGPGSLALGLGEVKATLRGWTRSSILPFLVSEVRVSEPQVSMKREESQRVSCWAHL